MSARRRDRDADPADLPRRLRRVRVVAHLGRQVERDRQAGLALLEEVAEAAVRLLGRGEARVLAHRPEPRAVHRGLDAAGERRLARQPEVAVRRRSRAPRGRRPCRGRRPRGRCWSRTARGAPAPSPAPSPASSPASARRRWSLTRSTASRSPTSIVSPGPTATRSTRAGRGAPELVLHLHRLDDEERRPGLDLVARHDRDGRDPARDRGPDLDRPGGRRRVRGPRRALPKASPGRRPRAPARSASRRRRPRRPTGRPGAGGSGRGGPSDRCRPAPRTTARPSPNGSTMTSPASSGATTIGGPRAGGRRGSARRGCPGSSRPPVDRARAAVARPRRAGIAPRPPSVAPRRGAERAGRRPRPPPRTRPRALAPGPPRRSAPTRRRPSRSTASPARNPSWRATNRWNGSVVWIPVTTVSSRARASRAIAAGRSASTTMSFAMSGS